jgi:hypothetical protein
LAIICSSRNDAHISKAVIVSDNINIDFFVLLSMRWALLSVRLGILVVSIITTMLLLLAVVPLAIGGLDIKLSQGQSDGWTYDNSTNAVSFTAPVQVYNGGFYDIKGFTVGIKLADQTGSVITECESSPTDIVAGRTNLVDIGMKFDLNLIQPSMLKELAFNHTTLNLSLSLSTYYMENLVNIHIGANQTMDWNPLIDNLNVDLPRMELQQNRTAYDILVPYSFDAGDIIVGQQVNVRSTLSDPSGIIGSGKDKVLIDNQNDGGMRMHISQEAAQRLVSSQDTLTVDIIVEFRGVELEQTYGKKWQPLISDLFIGEPEMTQGQAMTMNVPFSFNATSVIVEDQMQVECTLSNSTSTISQGSSSLIIGQHTTGQISLPLSITESAWFQNHSQDWTITLKGTVMGVTVQKTKSYHWTAPLGGT